MKNELLNHFYRLVAKNQDVIEVLRLYGMHATNDVIPANMSSFGNVYAAYNQIGKSTFWIFYFGGNISKSGEQVFTPDLTIFSETEMLEMSLLAKDPIILEKVKNLEAYV